MMASSDLRSTDLGFFSDDPFKDEEIEDSVGLPETCGICDKSFTSPVILNCLHIFDLRCLGDFKVSSGLMEYIKCPKCGKIAGDIKSLEPYDTTVLRQGVLSVSDADSVLCTLCTEGKEAQYRCIQCAGTLCERCRDTHKVMKLFSSHEVLDLSDAEKQNNCELQRTMQNSKPVVCTDHSGDVYTLFCVQCHVPLCKVCCESEHKGHITIGLNGVSKHIKSMVSEGLGNCHENQNVLRDTSDSLHSALSDLSLSRDTNKTQIEDLCIKWKSAIDTIRDELVQKNREIHSDIEMRLMTRINQLRKIVDHIDFVDEFCSSYLKSCSTVQVAKLVKPILGCIEHLKSVNFPSDLPSKIIFTEVPLDIHELIRCNFGSFDLPSSHETRLSPDYGVVSDKSLAVFNSYDHGDLSHALKNLDLKRSPSQIHPFAVQSLPMNLPEPPIDTIRGTVNGSLPPIGSHRIDSMNSVTTNISPWGDLGNFDSDSAVFSSAGATAHPIFMNQRMLMPHDGLQSPSTMGSNSMDLDSACLLSRTKLQGNYNASLYEYSRMRSARCSNMTLLTKWGSLGCDLSRLNSPHGFCLGFDEEIVVADTYNHRIQIFSKRGDFLSYFGVSGRVDGLLWYPRKVAIIRQSQRYVVCDRGNERSRMQLFSRSGHFVRRIQIKYIDIVAGLAINQHGHIVAIDSVTPSVFVMSEEGELIRWFDCSSHMKEPSDVAIHGREYYICDFKAHCVVVFQEDGSFIRTIGGESITDFPNGIDVSDHGDVLVGDSHGNRFHIAVFSSKGDLLSEFVCNQTKVSRSCCLKITTEGYVVTLARSSNNVLVMDTLYIS